MFSLAREVWQSSLQKPCFCCVKQQNPGREMSPAEHNIINTQTSGQYRDWHQTSRRITRYWPLHKSIWTSTTARMVRGLPQRISTSHSEIWGSEIVQWLSARYWANACHCNWTPPRPQTVGTHIIWLVHIWSGLYTAQPQKRTEFTKNIMYTENTNEQAAGQGISRISHYMLALSREL